MSFRFFIASFLLLMMTFSFSLGVVFADVHYANPGNYKSVLGAAGYSDTIIFNNGFYGVDEPIEVLESWKLFAANPGGAVLRATRSIHTLIDVWSSDVVVSGLVLDGNGLSNYGIHGNYEGHYAIDGNFNGNTIINNKRFGVLLTNTNSIFTNNYVASNGEVGIGLLDSPTSTLTGNTVVGSGYTGIYLYNSPGSSLTGNTVNGNGGHGIFLRLSPYSWIQNNNAVGNLWTGINLESSGSSAVVTNNANNNHISGIWLTGTDSTPIIGNTVQYNPYGVAFTNSNNNQVTYNNVIGNVYGITTTYSNPVSNNLIMDNSGLGINMDTYGNNLDSPPLLDNQIYRNGIGIRLVGNNNIIGTFLLENNSVFINNYALEFAGNGNLLDGTQFYGNANGLHLIGNGNVLTNLTVLYNTQNGIFIEGSNNRLNDSWVVNNTNGLIFNGNGNNINNLFFLNNTNSLTLNGNNNLLNGSGALNGTNGFFITGTNNIITNNSVSSHNGTAMYINGNNIVTGNSLTDNNGTGLVIRGDNDVVNFLNILGNTIVNNQNGIHVIGDNNNINSLLTLFNIILNNNCTLTITGNNNGMNNTILTLNRNGLVVNGDNNTLNNITARYNNQNGIILNGNNNTLNGSYIYNNTQGLMVNGSNNTLNGTGIYNNTNGTSINGDKNNLTQNNIHNNAENGLIVNGSNNTLTQNNITGNSNAVLVENGTNNTLNYNRVAGNTHNLHNQGHGTVDAEYNWWGQNTPTCITGMNINAGNHVVAVLNTPTGTINPGQIYDITLNLRSSDGQELTLEIPPFLVQFFINNGGDVYPETAPMTNNTAQAQFLVFNPGTYTLNTIIDQQTLTNVFSTPVNSQPVTANKIPRKPVVSTPTSNLCGAGALGYLLTAWGARANGNLITTIAGLTDQGISMYGLKEAAAHYGISLTGLHMDAGQLKPQDLLLLNINGNNHYTIYLGKIEDNMVLLDPYQGIVILNSNDFNKYFTGNILTTNPDGRGTLLSIDQMKSLIGGSDIATAVGNAFQLAESFFIAFPFKPLIPLAAVGAAGVFVGGLIYYYFIDPYVTPKGTGIEGIKQDLIGLPGYIYSLIPVNPEKQGTGLTGLINDIIGLPAYLWGTLQGIFNLDPKTKYDLTQEYISLSMAINYLSGLGGPPDDDRDIFGRLIEGARDAPWYFKILAYIAAGSLALPYVYPALYAGGVVLNNVLSSVGARLSAAKATIGKNISGVINWAADNVSRGAAQSIAAAKNVYNVARGAAQATYRATVQLGQNIYHAGQNIYRAAVNTVKTVARTVYHAGQNIYRSVVHTGQIIYNTAVHTGQAIYNAAVSGVNWVKGIIGW